MSHIVCRYQTDPDISAIGSLRTAYEKCDVSGFGTALDEINKTADTFIRTHLDSMVSTDRIGWDAWNVVHVHASFIDIM